MACTSCTAGTYDGYLDPTRWCCFPHRQPQNKILSHQRKHQDRRPALWVWAISRDEDICGTSGHSRNWRGRHVPQKPDTYRPWYGIGLIIYLPVAPQNSSCTVLHQASWVQHLFARLPCVISGRYLQHRFHTFQHFAWPASGCPGLLLDAVQ